MGRPALLEELATASGHLAVLSVSREDGSVHASLVSAGVLEDPATRRRCVGVVVAGDARKLALLRAQGRATVTFASGYRWVSAEGRAELHGPDDLPPDDPDGAAVPALLRRVFRAAGGTHDDWEAFDRVMAEERRCAVLVSVERVLANS